VTDPTPAAPANLSACLAHVLDTLEPQIRDSGAKITYEHLSRVLADEAQLVLLLQNLLSNALKYRKPGQQPEIHISAETQDGDCIVSIADNGIGFEPRYAERIFGLFKRLHSSEYPGTGLGLAICKRIVERHGGRIWAEGEPGKGSVFHFSLPLATLTEPRS
jgi:signal transduction histidine kinase